MPNTQFTSEEDLADGWTDSDWMHHEKKTGVDKLGEPGGVELWRFQLDRRLTPAERNKVALRDEEYSDIDVPRFNPDDLPPNVDPEALKPKPTATFNINKLLAVIRDVAPEIRVVRARIGGQEARAYAEWLPIYEERSGRRIVDPDGFREEGFTVHTVMTWEEFDRRATECTTAPVNRR